MSKTEIYPQPVSRARKSLRKPVSALRACKALYQTVQIFLLQYLFVISHRGWWALLCLQMRPFARATSQLTEHWMCWNNTGGRELRRGCSHFRKVPSSIGNAVLSLSCCSFFEITPVRWVHDCRDRDTFCGLWKFLFCFFVFFYSISFFVCSGCCCFLALAGLD